MFKTDHALNEFLKFNEEEITPLFPDLMNSVKDRKKIPFFGIGKSHSDVETALWENYFYPAQVFEGQQRYYWTIIM